MALPSSGQISLLQIATEFGGTVPHSLSEYYGAAAGVPASGTISFSHFYGKSAIVAAGYWAGGWTHPSTSEIDGILFSSETATNPSSNLSTTRAAGCGMSSSAKGYVLAGRRHNPFPSVVEELGSTEAFSLSTTTASSIAATSLVSYKDSMAGTMNSSNGYTHNANGQGERLAFSSETISSISDFILSMVNGSLIIERATASSSSNGYKFGGDDTIEHTNETHRFSFSTETSTRLSTVTGFAGPCSATYSTTNAYVAFGSGAVSTRFSLSSETASSISIPWLQAGAGTATTISISTSKGYHSGGFAPSNEIEGITFPTESYINPSATLATARYGHSGGIYSK